jgi:hypothetical protein
MKTKRIVLLVLLLLFSLAGAQKMNAQGYKSLFAHTTSWDLIHGGYCDNICSETDSITHDTLITGKTYKILSALGYLREDTMQGKTWFYNRQYHQEYLIMDLALNPGDSFTVYNYSNVALHFIADSVYFQNGLKHIRLSAGIALCALHEAFTFTEGAGPNASFNYQRNYNGSAASYMLCQHKDGVKTGTNKMFPGACHTCDLGIDEQSLDKTVVSCFPNPAGNQICIQRKFAGSSPLSVWVYNVRGELISTGSVMQETLKLDISDYPSGMYCIVTSNGVSKSVLKFLKA